MVELLDLTLLVFTFSSFYFRYLLSGTYNWLGVFILFVSIVYVLTPIKKVITYIFPERKARNETLSYEEAMTELDTDYDRENPILKGHALNQFVITRKNNVKKLL